MRIQEDQQRLTELVFAVTGEKLPSDDPLVVAALFYADTLRVAAKDAAELVESAGSAEREHLTRTAVEIRDAGASARLLVDESKHLLLTAANVQKALADSFEARLTEALRDAAKVQARQNGISMISVQHAALGALVALLLGAALFAFGTAGVCGYSFSWMNDASVGREFLRTLPTMNPTLRKKHVDHLQHSQK
jgi:hypothetical protein